MIRNQLRPAILLTVVFIVVTGLIYPGVVTAIARALFPKQSAGSLVTVNGQVVGSRLIGQQFTKPWYFHPRPSAAGNGYDATASGGSNKGPTDRKLADTLIAGAIAQAESEGVPKGKIPADMATADRPAPAASTHRSGSRLRITRQPLRRATAARARRRRAA